MWARAVLCAALLSALCAAETTEAERQQRGVQDSGYSSSSRLVGPDGRAVYGEKYHLKCRSAALGFLHVFMMTLLVRLYR